ncbi:MAG: ATP-binding protein [Candidatus Nitrosotenuis sp.]
MNGIFEISNYEDIANLWKNNQSETLNLEYKKEISSDPKEVAKDISSFANAEGGIIIYGVEEENGRAKSSIGIEIGQNSERIQQIISSSTAPMVPIELVNISIANKKKQKPTHEFIIVKIPKSPFMIHQVTTTSKYYIRNNTITTAHIYQPFEMKENEIALRYENRYKSRQELQNFFEEKEKKIAKTLGWNSYLLISVVPHIRIPESLRITKEYFRSLFQRDSLIIYNEFPVEASSTYSIPNFDGRSSDPHRIKRDYVEVDNDRSIHFCMRLDSEFRINMYRPMFSSCPFLHTANRILADSGYYGGATFRLKVNGSITTERSTGNYELETGGRTVSDFEIQHEIPYTPIKVKDEFLKIYQKYFESLHIDNALQIYKDTNIKTIFDELDASESRLNNLTN